MAQITKQLIRLGKWNYLQMLQTSFIHQYVNHNMQIMVIISSQKLAMHLKNSRDDWQIPGRKKRKYERLQNGSDQK